MEDSRSFIGDPPHLSFNRVFGEAYSIKLFSLLTS